MIDSHNHSMTDPTTWDAAKREERLKRLFEEITGTFAEEGVSGYLEVEFENDTRVYQYMPDCHNVTGINSEMVAAMDEVIEQYDLDVIDRGDNRSTLESLVSGIKGMFSGEAESESEVVEWVTACHGRVESVDEVYTVFAAVCETVYGHSLVDVTEAFINPNTGEEIITWTDV